MLPSVGASELEQVAKGAIRTAFLPIADMTSATDESTMISDTLPVAPVERTIPYVVPFDRWDRVEDNRITWEFFNKRGVGG